ncbi:MAG: hypothetical protein FJZ16_06315, partial [Candidatus Omnitrophica bacterium]|nr:hypothetical protein [Candidatus Omnitrophota bacterium]
IGKVLVVIDKDSEVDRADIDLLINGIGEAQDIEVIDLAQLPADADIQIKGQKIIDALSKDINTVVYVGANSYKDIEDLKEKLSAKIDHTINVIYTYLTLSQPQTPESPIAIRLSQEIIVPVSAGIPTAPAEAITPTVAPAIPGAAAPAAASPVTKDGFIMQGQEARRLLAEAEFVPADECRDIRGNNLRDVLRTDIEAIRNKIGENLDEQFNRFFDTLDVADDIRAEAKGYFCAKYHLSDSDIERVKDAFRELEQAEFFIFGPIVIKEDDFVLGFNLSSLRDESLLDELEKRLPQRAILYSSLIWEMPDDLRREFVFYAVLSKHLGQERARIVQKLIFSENYRPKRALQEVDFNEGALRVYLRSCINEQAAKYYTEHLDPELLKPGSALFAHPVYDDPRKFLPLDGDIARSPRPLCVFKFLWDGEVRKIYGPLIPAIEQARLMFVDKRNQGHFKEMATRVFVDIILYHLTGENKAEGILRRFTQKELETMKNILTGPDPINLTAAAELRRILPEFNALADVGSPPWNHLGNLSSLKMPLPIVGVFSRILGQALNPNQIAKEVGFASAFAEKQVLDWMSALIGYDSKGGGIPSNSGYQLANQQAMDIARNILLKDERVTDKGVSDKDLVILVPKGYDSALEIANYMGIGSANVWFVELDENLQMDTNDLERKLREAEKQHKKVISVIAVAGRRDTASIDPIDRIADITEPHNVRLHVDASSVSMLLFEEGLKKSLKGIKRANSVTLDLFGYSGTFLRDFSERGFIPSTAPYVGGLGKGEDLAVNFGRYTEEGSREFEALRLWLIWKWMGTENLGLWAKLSVAQARTLRDILRDYPDLETYGNDSIPFFAVRFNPPAAGGKVEGLQGEVAEEMQKENKARAAFIDSGYFKDSPVLRISTLNPYLSEVDLRAFVESLSGACVGVGERHFGSDFALRKTSHTETEYQYPTAEEIARLRGYFVDPAGSNIAQAQSIGSRICNAAIDYQARTRGEKVLDYKTDEELAAIFSDTAPCQGEDFDRLIAEYRGKIEAYQLSIGNPSYISHMVTGPTAIHLLINMYLDSLNIETDDSRGLVGIQFMHDRVVRQLGWLMGYGQDRCSGFITSGGTIANRLAMLAMRNRFFANRGIDVGKIGMAKAIEELGKRCIILVSAERHYSWEKLGGYVGLGAEQIVRVAVDKNMRMRLDDLKEKIADAKARGEFIIGIVANAGTTETGNFDPLSDIAKIAQGEGCWLHVDAAFGGLVAISRNEDSRNLMQGVGEANSLTLDPHKWDDAPYSIGAVLIKDKKDMEYLEVGDRGEMYLPRGRAMLGGASLYSVLQTFWLGQMQAVIDENIRLTKKYWLPLLKACPDIEVLSEPDINILTFRYASAELQEELKTATPKRRDEINRYLNWLNTKIQEAITQDGRIGVSSTTMERSRYTNDDPSSPSSNIVALRVVLMNPFTTEEVLDRILEIIKEIGDQLSKST